MRNILTVFAFFSFLVFVSCKKETEKQTSATDTLDLKIVEEEKVDCRSLITDVDFSLSREGLIEYYGKENHTDDTLYAEGEVSGFASVLWKGTPREIQIIWQDEQMAKSIGFMLENNKSNRKILDRFYVGMSLKELVEANGDAVELSGFGWDYGGGCCFGERKGILAKYPCLSFTLDLSPEAYESEEVNNVLGDMLIGSESDFFEKHSAFVQSIYVYF